ncbi:hypothetical protein AB210_0988 [Acinetobacter baumannii AB210]|nr:hypothetical protein AB210_0988 [Acinetobacter baumannii AB210]
MHNLLAVKMSRLLTCYKTVHFHQKDLIEQKQ